MGMQHQNLHPNVATLPPHSLRTIDLPTIGERENETITSHCADVVFAAQKKITCCLSVLIRSTSNATFARLWVILRPLAVVDRTLVRLNNIRILLPPHRNS